MYSITASREARSRGVELEAKVSLTDSLSIAGSYTYLNTVYTKDNGGLQGKHLPAVPQNQASLWAYYTINRGPLAGLSMGAGGRYTGTTYSTDNDSKVQSFFLFDATLRYDLGRASSQLKGAELYVNAQDRLRTPGVRGDELSLVVQRALAYVVTQAPDSLPPRVLAAN